MLVVMEKIQTMNIRYAIVCILLMTKQLIHCAVQTELNGISKFPLSVILKKENVSVVSSPIHVRLIMCKLLEVASDDARQEIIRFLGIGSIRDIRECFTQYVEMFNNIASLDSFWINFLYVNNTKNIMESFINRPPSETGVAVREADLNSPGFSRSFNEMASSVSLGRLRDIFKPGDVNSKTKLGLVSLSYYKTFWDSPFDPQETQNEQFISVRNTSFTVPMMKKIAQYVQYFEDDNYKIKGAKIDTKLGFLTIIMPKNPNDLKKFVEDMYNDETKLLKLLNKTENVEMIVKIPRFQTRCVINIASILKNLGVKKIFESNSTGLKNIFRLKFIEPNIYVNFAKQNVMFEVAESFPVTMHVSKQDRMRKKISELRVSHEFIANRPFYYRLTFKVDKTLHDIISGVYYGPQSNTVNI